MRNLHHAWPDLLRVALLGTRQTAEPVPVLPELTSHDPASSANGAAEDREKQLLLTAGALSLVRKAGFQPALAPETTSLPTPAEPETLPTLGATGRHLLHALLEGPHSALLPEYLRQLAAAGRRVPHALLVPLLEFARSQPALYPVVAQVLGRRGAWLAALNPRWEALRPAAPTDEATWETGTIRQRVAFLAARRRTDPAGARALLLAALPQESAREQVLLLGVLAEHLGWEDEPLLTQYLASKSKEVRQSVLPLLARVPGGALAARLWARAEPLLQLKTNPDGAQLSVTLPAAWDKSWLADGIELKDSRFEGEKAAWLGQLLALVPPARWSAHWQLPPAAILGLAASSEWAPLLLRAWHAALLLHPAAEWGRAYAQRQLTQDPMPPLTAGQAVALVGAGAAHELLLNALPAPAALRQPPARWEAWLLTMPGPWPLALTEQALLVIGHTLQATGYYGLNPRLSELLRHMQLAVDEAQYEHCAAAFDELLQLNPAIQTPYNHFLDTLHFRGQLIQTLGEAPGADG